MVLTKNKMTRTGYSLKGERKILKNELPFGGYHDNFKKLT